MGWMREDGQSNIVVHDNSTNGIWVCVSFALALHPAPIFDPPTPHALKTPHAHTLTLILSRTQINSVRVTRGESYILRDGNEIA